MGHTQPGTSGSSSSYISSFQTSRNTEHQGSGRVVRWSWVNFRCRGVLLVWIRVGQGPTALAVGAGGGCLDVFALVYPFSSLSPSLWETTRYRLKYCLKGSLSPKTTNQRNISNKKNSNKITQPRLRKLNATFAKLFFQTDALFEHKTIHRGPGRERSSAISWLVGCFGLYGPLRQYFSLYRAVSQREGERKK